VVDKDANPADSEKEKGNSIPVFGLDGLLNKSDDVTASADKPDMPGGPGKEAGAFSNRPANSREIPVQIGLEGDYYTEVISPEIKEGMTVLVNSTAGELMSDFEMMMGGGPD
jgi:hypothetical protein